MMKHEEELKAIHEAQIKALEEKLRKLEGEEKALMQSKEIDKDVFVAKSAEIIDTKEQISEIKATISELDVRDKTENGLKENKKLVEIAKGFSELLDQSGEALAQYKALEEARLIAYTQNQIVAEQHETQEQVAVIENISGKLKTPQEVAVEKIKDLQDFTDKIGNKLEDAYEEVNRTPDLVEPEAVKKWKNDIADKEKKLNDTHENQLKAINDNNAMLVIQKMDIKRFPDAEKKLEQLKPIEEAMEKEYKNIEEKFKNGKDELTKEKIALSKAIDTTQNMDDNKRQEAIQEQKREFERQRELERLRELQDGRKKP